MRGYSLGFLVQSVAVPVRVDHLKAVDDPVVLAQPHDVHTGQRRVLIDAAVAGPVAKLALLDVGALVVAWVGGVRQQLAAVVVQRHVHAARRPRLGPQRRRLVGRRAVHLRAVDERRNLVHLLARAQPAARTHGGAHEVEAVLVPV